MKCHNTISKLKYKCFCSIIEVATTKVANIVP